MWDLIVSVPDHCLSFYFIMGKVRIDIYCYLCRYFDSTFLESCFFSCFFFLLLLFETLLSQKNESVLSCKFHQVKAN